VGVSFSAARAAILTSGNLSTSYDGTDPWFATDLVVGNTAPGNVTINGGSQAYANHGATIGNTVPASNSAVVVDGDFTYWQPGGVTIGYYGSGKLDITNGANVSSTSGTLGGQVGGTGTVNVDGVGGRYASTWSASGINVGSWGTGFLNITNGGRVTSTASSRIGSNPGSSGSVTVAGQGSDWTLLFNADLSVGFTGTATLVITDGATVSSNTGYVANASTGTATVGGGTGTSSWTVSNLLTVGYNGLGTLNINSGGLVSAGTLDGNLFPITAANSSINLDGGTLRIKATDSAPNVIKLKSGGGTIDVPTTATTLTLTRGMSGVGKLTKTGAATLDLAAANTYTGETSISAGTLKLSDFGSLATSPVITLASGTKFDVAFVTGGSNYDGSRFSLASGQTLNGIGTVIGALGVGADATLAPGNDVGILNTGKISIAPEGTVAIDLAGTTPGVGYDRIVASNEFQFGGTLDVHTAGGFEPALGNSFDILDFNGSSGTFAALSLPVLPDNLMWDISRLYTAGILKVALTGDFNGDNAVNAADYVTWRSAAGTPQQYDLWRSNFGATAPAGSPPIANREIAEPASMWFLFIAILSASTSWPRRRPLCALAIN
jgi:T5SS/PEP-CTERM-associated repeat protein/autotransporter-associated beta strand protein